MLYLLYFDGGVKRSYVAVALLVVVDRDAVKQSLLSCKLLLLDFLIPLFLLREEIVQKEECFVILTQRRWIYLHMLISHCASRPLIKP